MLGQYIARYGVTDRIGAASGIEWRKSGHNNKVIPANYNHALPKEAISLAEVFKNNGYNTFFAGK